MNAEELMEEVEAMTSWEDYFYPNLNIDKEANEW